MMLCRYGWDGIILLHYYSNLTQLNGDMESAGRREREPDFVAHKYSTPSACVS